MCRRQDFSHFLSIISAISKKERVVCVVTRNTTAILLLKLVVFQLLFSSDNYITLEAARSTDSCFHSGLACMSHKNRELVVPVPDEGHLWQPSYSVHASVEILFIYFTCFCLSLV